MDSGILYSAVAKQSVVLVSSQRSTEDFESVTKSFLPTISVDVNTKTCFPSGMFNYHILVHDMLIYICVTETDFGRNIPYAFLNEIKKRFTSGSLAIRALGALEHEFDRDFSHILEEQMIKFSSEYEVDSIGKVKKQVKEVMGVMTDNIEKVCERGEKLDTLIDKTSELEITSGQFKSTAKKVRRRMWLKNVKMWIIIGFLLAAVLTIIILVSTNVIPVKSS